MMLSSLLNLIKGEFGKIRVPWRLIHDIWVGGIKTQSSSRKAISDKVHPKKLN